MLPVLLAALFLVPAPAVKLPTLAQLVRAAASNDDVEIERVAARFGAVKLARIAERGQPKERLAALRALGVVDDAAYLLPDLSKLLGDDSDDIAEAAARSVRQIAAGLSPQAMFDGEVPRDVPARAAAALQEAALHGRTSSRVAALAALAALRPVAKIDDARLASLLADADPQVRHAAADALGGSPAADAPLMKALEADSAVEVAAAAAAGLCRDVPPTGEKGTERAARLTPPARERLRQLAADEKIALVDRLDLMGCLRVHAQPPDQKVLDQLAHAKLEPLKRRARSLGGR
jgi:HEAT repeat protein